VFVQALLVTIVIFIVGFYIGITVEGGHLNQINNYYTQSETSLIDILSLNNLINSNTVNCAELVSSDKALLDKVYTEAQLLDQYNQPSQLTNDLEYLHTKYDALRTYLWVNSINIKKECNSTNFPTIVYLYNQNEQDLTKKAEQNVWSKLLLEVKNEDPNVALIPIAVDSNLTSLDAMTSKFNITSYPAVIVNENYTFYTIPKKDEILNLISQPSSQ
jgi:hypothetical protein